MLHLLRRGQREALVHSIAFNKTGEALAVSSASGTVHVFHATETTATASADTAGNKPQKSGPNSNAATAGSGGGGFADRVESLMGAMQSTMGGGMRSVAKVHLPPMMMPSGPGERVQQPHTPVSIVSLSDDASVLSIITQVAPLQEQQQKQQQRQP